MSVHKACTDQRTKGNAVVDASMNLLIPDRPITKVAVLELSTRACKLLVADIKRLENGFSWDAFKNESHLTNTGHLIDSNGHLPWKTFKTNVLPSIKKLLKRARHENVNVLYCVATAAIRSAVNQHDILFKLKKSIDLNVQVLDQDQESAATVRAFKWGTENIPIQRTILMDQGGGSTELSAFCKDLNRLSFDEPTQIPMGTTSAIQRLFHSHLETDDLKSCLIKTSQNMEQFINRATYPLQQTPQPFERLVALGSALTDATQKKSNQFQHNTKIDRIGLLLKQEEALSALTQQFQNLDSLKAHLQHDLHTSSETQRLLVTYFGLGMVVNVLDRLNLHEVTVYGIGLRYGICHQHIITQLRSYSGQSEDQKNVFATQIDGLHEGSWIVGTISNIDPRYGIFVRLNEKYTGLVHIKVLRQKRLSLSSFRRKESLRVYLKRIQHTPKPRFHLVLPD